MKEKTYVAVDVETLDVDPSNNAAIVQIGICIHTAYELIRTDSIAIDPSYAPGTRSAETIRWWNKQDPVVREKVFSGTLTPAHAVATLNSVIMDVSEYASFWANPARFDFTHLRALYAAVGASPPWLFYQEKCLQTAKFVACEVWDDARDALDKVKKTNTAAHNARADAENQAAQLMWILQRAEQNGAT